MWGYIPQGPLHPSYQLSTTTIGHTYDPWNPRVRHGPTPKVKAPFLFGRRTYYIHFHLYNNTLTRDRFKANMTALALTHARSTPVMTAQACHTLADHTRANMDSFSSISRPFRCNFDAFNERMGALTSLSSNRWKLLSLILVDLFAVSTRIHSTE